MISKYMMAFSQISQLGYWNKILHWKQNNAVMGVILHDSTR